MKAKLAKALRGLASKLDPPPDEKAAANTALKEGLPHLETASLSLGRAATIVEKYTGAGGEEGVLVEEVVDVAHRIHDLKDRNTRKVSTSGEGDAASDKHASHAPAAARSGAGSARSVHGEGSR